MNRRQKKKQFKRRFGFNPPPTIRSIAGISNKGNSAAEAAGKRGNAD